MPGGDDDRADDQRGPGERREPGPLVEHEGAEPDRDERVHVLVRHDLRDRRVAQQPDVGAEADDRAGDREVRPRRDGPRLEVGPVELGSFSDDERGAHQHETAAEHLVDRRHEGVGRQGEPARDERPAGPRHRRGEHHEQGRRRPSRLRSRRARRRARARPAPPPRRAPSRGAHARPRGRATRRSGAGPSRRSSPRRPSRSASRQRARARRRAPAARRRARAADSASRRSTRSDRRASARIAASTAAAARNRVPAVRSGGSVRTASLIPRYVEPQTR